MGTKVEAKIYGHGRMDTQSTLTVYGTTRRFIQQALMKKWDSQKMAKVTTKKTGTPKFGERNTKPKPKPKFHSAKVVGRTKRKTTPIHIKARCRNTKPPRQTNKKKPVVQEDVQVCAKTITQKKENRGHNLVPQ